MCLSPLLTRTTVASSTWHNELKADSADTALRTLNHGVIGAMRRKGHIMPNPPHEIDQFSGEVMRSI